MLNYVQLNANKLRLALDNDYSTVEEQQLHFTTLLQSLNLYSRVDVREPKAALILLALIIENIPNFGEPVQS